MLPWKLQKRQILTVNQNLLSAYFSLAKFQLVSCNLSLAMIWQMTYTHKLPKLCSATLKERVRAHVIRSKQGHIVRLVQSFQYPRTVNSVSILFSWHKKTLGVVLERPSFLP